MNLSCPTRDRLRKFLERSIDDAETEQISGHVVECPNCDRVLSTLESEQSDVLSALRDAVHTESLLQEPEFEELRNTARLGRADTSAPPDVDELPETGKRLRDYRLVRKIGEGGMGTVYQAVHVHLAKHVALKILPADKLRSRQSVSRFRQEMRAVGRVNHPNVVSASDAGTIDGQHFLVMELVQGADLARIIHDRGLLDVGDACEIVRQAAIGLQHAHDNGLVHRDVKPSNIMLALDGSVKLLDLGLAGLNNTELESATNVVVTDRLTSVGQIMGTLDYMAPEQITASPQVDGKADVYALGATLFHLLTGRTPCGDRSEATPERIEAVLHKPPLDIATLRDDIPNALCSLLLTMLAKNPQDRPQSATDVADALRRFTSEADLAALAEACRTSLDIPSADVDVTDEVSFVVSRIEPQRDGGVGGRSAAIGLASLFLTFVAAVLYYIVTDTGVVRVQVFDESFKVAIDDQTVTVHEGNNQPIKLRPGEHKLVVSQGDTELVTDNFELHRNDEIAIKVDLLKGVIISNHGKEVDKKPLPARASPRGLTDEQRMLVDLASDERFRRLTKNAERLTPEQARSYVAFTELRARSFYGLTTLDLSNVSEISDEVATQLARHRGWLMLNGLTTLSNESAEALSRHQGRLYLNALTSLSDEAAKALAQHRLTRSEGEDRGGLHLDGLPTLSDEAARALAKAKGDLYLRGLRTLTDEAATILRQNQKARISAALMSLTPTKTVVLEESPVIELKWAVSEHIPGFTDDENRGDYLEDTFYSIQPVLTLTRENVASARYYSGTLPPSGDLIFHSVHIKLTDEATAILESEIRRLRTDDSKWGKVRYVTLLIDGEPGFSATVSDGRMGGFGFTTPNWRSAAHAQRVLNALVDDEPEHKHIPQITQLSAVALVNGCEVSGRFTADQAEVVVLNPTQESRDVSFHYQVVYQSSLDRDDIVRFADGEFKATVPPGKSTSKHLDNLLDVVAGIPTRKLKDLLAIRVFDKPIRTTTDYPIALDKRIEIAQQPVTIASWPAAATEFSKSKRKVRLREGREGITAVATTGSHCRVSGSFTQNQARFWVVNPQGANRKDLVYYQVILRDSKSPDDIILLKEGKLALESEYGSVHVRHIDLRSDPDASVPTDHGKDTIELRISQAPLDLNYIPITPEEEPYVLREAVTIASWPTRLVAVNTKGRLAFVRERELKGLATRVAKVAWAADGKTVCAVDGTGQLRVWDTATGDQVVAQNLGMTMSTRPIALSADLELMAISLGEQVSIRRVADNVEVTRISPPLDPKRKHKFLPELAAMAFSPDDKRLLIGSTWASVWDVETGKLIYKSRKLVTTSCAVTWSRDGKRFAAHTAGYSMYSDIRPAEVCIWDSESGEELNTFTIRPHGQYGYDFGKWVATDYIAFSPDGHSIAVASGTRGARDQESYESQKCFVQLLDLKTGETTRVVPEFSMAVGSLRFSSGGSLLAMHSGDKVRFWETESGQQLTTLQQSAKIISFDIHPREDVVVTGQEDGSVRLRQLRRGAAGRDTAARHGNVQSPTEEASTERSGTFRLVNGIIESHRIWDSRDAVKATDLARYRDQWICVMQTDSGLNLIGSKDGQNWGQLSTVTSSSEERSLRDPQLSETSDGRLMLNAVERGIHGYSQSWFSYDAVRWKAPVPMAEDHYLVSNVFWHTGVAYNFQRGSICGNADVRIGVSNDHGQSFQVRYEDLDLFGAGKGALVFSQDDGYCVMPRVGEDNKVCGFLGVSKAPFWQWKWKKLSVALTHPNAIRTESGSLLVVAGIPDDEGTMQTTLCEIDPANLSLRRIETIPTGKSCFVGLAKQEDQVFLTYHTVADNGSTVHMAKLVLKDD